MRNNIEKTITQPATGEEAKKILKALKSGKGITGDFHHVLMERLNKLRKNKKK